MRASRRILPVMLAIAVAVPLLGCNREFDVEYKNANGPINPPTTAAPPPPPVTGGYHVILFIGDGMQLEHEVAASRYLYGRDFGLEWHGFPEQAYGTTWDVNTYNAYASDASQPVYDESTFNPAIGYDTARGGVAPFPLDITGQKPYLLRAATDSASAATAMATGVKTDRGNISWLRSDPPGGEIETIAEKMRRLKGASIGVVSTVPFNHATPAAFVSHNVSRGNYAAIANKIINTTAPEVVIGGGHPNYRTGYVTAAQLSGLRNSAEYFLVERTGGVDGGAALLSAANSLPPSMKLFGLFGGGGGNFDPPAPVDNPGSPSFNVNTENPSLADATEAALIVLSRDKDGFFLMVEQGDIDWANHANNYSWMIGVMWDLEKAVKRAEAFVDKPGDRIDWSNTLLLLTTDHGNSFMRLTDSPVLGAGDLPRQVGTTYPDGEVVYGTGGHTNELVTIYAMGNDAKLLRNYEGSWYGAPRIIDNTHIFKVMAKAAGVGP